MLKRNRYRSMALLLTIPLKVAVSKNLLRTLLEEKFETVSPEQFPATDCHLFGGIAFVQVNIITKA